MPAEGCVLWALTCLTPQMETPPSAPKLLPVVWAQPTPQPEAHAGALGPSEPSSATGPLLDSSPLGVRPKERASPKKLLLELCAGCAQLSRCFIEANFDALPVDHKQIIVSILLRKSAT